MLFWMGQGFIEHHTRRSKVSGANSMRELKVDCNNLVGMNLNVSSWQKPLVLSPNEKNCVPYT